MDRKQHLSQLLDLALNELGLALTKVARLRIPDADAITAHLMGVRLKLLLAKRDVERLVGR